MFSRNGKISEKQLKRMVVLPFFASVIFVLPYLSAKMFGESIVPGLFTFFVLSGIYVLYICVIGSWYEKSRRGKEGYISVLTQSGLVGNTLAVITFARIVIRLAFYILLAMEILKEAQVPFMSDGGGEMLTNLLVVLPLLLVALYGANRDVEKQGRIHEMIFWVLFIPFIIVILFGLKEVDYEVFVPKADMPFGNMVLCAYLLLTFVLPVENYLYLRPDLKVRGKMKNRVKEDSTGVEGESEEDSGESSEGKDAAGTNSVSVEGSGQLRNKEKTHIAITIIGVLLLSIIITLFILGIYGVHGAADDAMVTISIMRYIRLPFGVLERFDVLMIWFFMTGCFVLICGTLYFAGHIFQKIWSGAGRIWVLIVVLVLALGIVIWAREYDNGLLTFICYGAVIDIPFSILLPLLGIGVNKMYAEESE